MPLLLLYLSIAVALFLWPRVASLGIWDQWTSGSSKIKLYQRSITWLSVIMALAGVIPYVFLNFIIKQ